MAPPDRDIRYLYKYRALNDAQQLGFLERTLLHNELYFARPSEFNDPFDCSPVPRKYSQKEIKDYLDRLWRERSGLSRHDRRAQTKAARNRISDFEAEQRRMITTIMTDVGVLSLSAKNDDVLMWAHYAGAHTGVCLRFRVSATNPYFAPAFEVHYQDERPILDIMNTTPFAQSRSALLTKATYWSYEQEWRMIEHEGPPGIKRFPGELLDGVILGARTSDDNRRRVLSLISERRSETEVMQARFDDRRFAVNIGRLGK